jgi:hypothetical protein
MQGCQDNISSDAESGLSNFSSFFLTLLDCPDYFDIARQSWKHGANFFNNLFETANMTFGSNLTIPKVVHWNITRNLLNEQFLHFSQTGKLTWKVEPWISFVLEVLMPDRQRVPVFCFMSVV